jgi:glycosyltransferase involved in cell wall biosynthesis
VPQAPTRHHVKPFAPGGALRENLDRLNHYATIMETQEKQVLSGVIPAHNEEPGIEHALEVIGQVLEPCGMDWEIIVIDDGSRDRTFDQVRAVAGRDARIKGLRFSRNFGKEAALLAGLNTARGDAVVTIDADLQHPPHLIPAMIEAWRQGARVVDGVKRNRETDGAFARARAAIFNSVLSRLGGISMENSSDFKLLDRLVVQTITRELPERQRFYRGLSDWVGYKHASILFDVESRTRGQGKWNLWGLVGLATTALISFTSAPLRIVTVLGMATFLFGVIVASEAFIGWIQGRAVSGFTTTIFALLIIGSTIMISLGIIGEYIAKIYDEIKRRPAYLIEGTVGIEPGKTLPVHAGSDPISAQE